MRVKYGTAAAKSGARIISLCGFDSVPSDLSIFAAVQALRAKVPDAQVETARTWHSVFGMAGGGTLATMHQMQPDIGRCFLDSSNNNSLRPVLFMLFDPLVLTHPETVRFNPDHQDDRNRMALAEWWNLLPYPHTIFKQGVSIPFFMGVCNSKVVHASALALNYGPNISYYERFLPLGFELTLGFGLFSTIPSLIILFAIAMGGLILQIPILSDLLLKVFAPPGTGASDEMCAKGHAEVYAEVKAPLSVAGKVSCANVYMEFQGDPGNMVTAQCVVESALSLVLDRDNLPPRSKDGFGTPAELLGPVLLQRLRNTKVRPVTVKTNVRKSEREHEYKVYIF
ncbi:Putative trans-acting enoyl reductase [Seminavis robusta]|uniref:Trans-acting enoyl reductase n=1 Tax=Seminavis robusta TaxID=568900 RepID=A0A9N8E1Q0_9STRA|nr:Putative trans-acting enoyl reductase [Seminavis robusta]|eukprot:Sro458_g146980.1 Putative trans-acting enoyl reductase (340) ;mRNA; f:14-1033